ncbi:MAG: PAS domain-containing protein [Hyphomicrobiales bacterium]
MYDEHGTPIHMIGSHIDISEKSVELARVESEQFARATLDGLSAHIAIIDADGTIVAVNRAWREFGAQNLPANLPPSPPADVGAAARTRSLREGANYVAVCRAAAAGGCSEAQQWLDGMAAVLAGETDLAEFEYPCHSPSEQRWFVVRISRMPVGDPPRLVVAHENITGRKLVELEREQLQRQEAAGSRRPAGGGHRP